MTDKKQNIVLIGMPGCGKTTTGRMISKVLQLPFYDVDDVIQDISHKSIHDLFIESEHEFRKCETEAIKKITANNTCVIATGGGAVKHQQNMDILKCNSIIFFIDRKIENIMKNIDIKSRALFKNGKNTLCQLYDERIELYLKYMNYKVNNNGSIDDTVRNIIEIYKNYES